LHHIVVCGKDVRGHKTGQALMCVHRNGIRSDDGKIIGAIGPNPFLTVHKQILNYSEDRQLFMI
jgi:tetrahydromethanopterin S-methyltransferase subunit A